MKEIYPPFNDWWQADRKLRFGKRKFNASLHPIMENLVPADRLANSVILGIKKLENSKFTKNSNTMSLQEKLRPLFCPVEINFMSDDKSTSEKNDFINIPLEFFVNKKLVNKFENIVVNRRFYEHALKKNNSLFPETLLDDADHAWLTPVKSISDQLAIEHLIKVGLINEKFVSDVLSVDMTNPVFSTARCHLLKYVPSKWSINWQNQFKYKLKVANDKSAKLLLNHLEKPTYTLSFYQKNTEKFLRDCRIKLKSSANVEKLFLLLLQRRAEIKASEISKNHLGQILEPDFRVIFPKTNINSTPGKLMLTNTCEVKIIT